jgi:hypothetical protein
VLFNTIGAPEGSAPGATNQTTSTTTSAPQVAGLVTMRNSSLLTSSLPIVVLCPAGHGSLINGQCRNFSVPALYNDVFWENRSYYIGVGALGPGILNQQNQVELYSSFTNAPAPSQPGGNGSSPSSGDATATNGNGVIVTGGTGACTAASYWDIGVRGDSGPNNHSSGLTLAPVYSVLTDAGDYPGNNNLGSNPTLARQYCNGSRIPPELGTAGYQVPPGIADAQVPNPVFQLQPAATVDEGNNWINISWGPLAETNPAGVLLGNYALASGSPAINYIPRVSVAFLLAPSTDFNGNPRPASPLTGIDVGAVEFQGASTPLANVSPTVVNFGNVLQGTTSGVQTVTLSNSGPGALTGIAATFSGGFARAAGAAGGTCTATLAAPTILVPTQTCTIGIVFTAPNPATGAQTNGTLALAASRTILGSPVALSATSAAPPTLASVNPISGLRGSSTTVTLSGANFSTLDTGSTVQVAPATGVTVSNVTVLNASTITATLTIAGNAPATARTISVTTGGFTTNTVPFTVTSPPPPTLTAISPASHTRGGGAFPVTLTGSNFTTGSTVAVSGGFFGGVIVTGVTVMSSTTITANFTILAGAPQTSRNVTVTTPGGTSSAVAFKVGTP